MNRETSNLRRKPRRWPRRVGIGVLAFLLVLMIAVAGLWLAKPWAPKFVVAEPGPGGSWVENSSMVGQWYPTGSSPGPAVLIFGGSEGGLNPGVTFQAASLRDAGFSVLAISYFGAPGQSDALVDIGLETFTTALDWLTVQPEVDPNRLGILGTSKGGEAALLIASRDQRVKAVVANVPSHVVWQGLNLQEPWKMGTASDSSWSWAGQPLPYVPIRPSGGMAVADTYRNSLAAGVAPEAMINLAAIKAPVLATCGGQDKIWPSCLMAEEVRRGATNTTVTLLSYPEAGHLIGAPPGNIPVDLDESVGGTPSANSAARADAWPKIIDHLRQTLGHG